MRLDERQRRIASPAPAPSVRAECPDGKHQRKYPPPMSYEEPDHGRCSLCPHRICAEMSPDTRVMCARTAGHPSPHRNGFDVPVEWP